MTTPNIGLPNLLENSLQLSPVFNDAMQMIDALLVLEVEDKDLNSAPATTEADVGKRWIVGPSPSGVWEGRAGAIAVCTGPNLWLIIPAKPGMRAFVKDEDKFYRRNVSAWVESLPADVTIALSALTDVNIDAPEEGYTLIYQSGEWVAAPPSAQFPDIPQDYRFRFKGSPASLEEDWAVVGRACTISAASPGVGMALTPPASTWTADIRKNNASVGTVSISSAGVITWSIPTDIELVPGDKLSVVAPESPDGSIQDIQFLLRAKLIS